MQIDGSEHRQFEDRGDPGSLLVFIDDATGKLIAAALQDVEGPVIITADLVNLYAGKRFSA